MQRIYLSDIAFTQELVITQKELYHQITRVMRAKVGQKYAFFDGITQQDFIYEIQSIDKQKVIFQLVEIQEKHTELPLSLHLFQSLPHKLEKREYIIEKWVEVGYRSFVFFPSERSQKIIVSESKKQRLKKIMIEALEQCGGNILPELYFIENNIILQWGSEYLQKVQYEWGIKNIFCHTKTQDIWNLSGLHLKKFENIWIYIGPEGWFTDREVESMKEKGYTWVNFWSRILRCETVSSVLWFYLHQKKED